MSGKNFETKLREGEKHGRKKRRANTAMSGKTLEKSGTNGRQRGGAEKAINFQNSTSHLLRAGKPGLTQTTRKGGGTQVRNSLEEERGRTVRE